MHLGGVEQILDVLVVTETILTLVTLSNLQREWNMKISIEFVLA